MPFKDLGRVSRGFGLQVLEWKLVGSGGVVPEVEKLAMWVKEDGTNWFEEFDLKPLMQKHCLIGREVDLQMRRKADKG